MCVSRVSAHRWTGKEGLHVVKLGLCCLDVELLQGNPERNHRLGVYGSVLDKMGLLHGVACLVDDVRIRGQGVGRAGQPGEKKKTFHSCREL